MEVDTPRLEPMGIPLTLLIIFETVLPPSAVADLGNVWKETLVDSGIAILVFWL